MISYICPPIAVRILDNGVRVDLATGLGVLVPVPSGPPGRRGPKGDTGAGVPPGGAAGQYLRKASAAEDDTEWSDLPTPPVIPTKVSDLQNDSGFVDAAGAAAAAPVQSVNGQTGDVSVPTLSLLDVYPVGSIYMSVNSTSPATLFGGTWEQIQDTFLLAAGPNHAAGSTGGEENHVLTVDEMPSHNHGFNGDLFWSSADGGWASFRSGTSSSAGTALLNTQSKGGGQAHNNMPPFLAVYVWKRTA